MGASTVALASVPAVPLRIQVPTNAPGKAVGRRPKSLHLCIYAADLEEAPGSQLQSSHCDHLWRELVNEDLLIFLLHACSLIPSLCVSVYTYIFQINKI